MSKPTIEERHADHVNSGGTLSLDQFKQRERRREEMAARNARMELMQQVHRCPSCGGDVYGDEDECETCGDKID